jgi:sugar phosphate isomerase/epimerase
MMTRTRRDFVKLAAAGAALGAMPGAGLLSAAEAGALPHAAPAAARVPYDLGIASYTFRSFPLDQALAMTSRLRVKKITLKDMHLPMAVTAAEMAAVREKLKAAGIELSSCGVVYMRTEEQVHKGFEYAKLAGIKMMVGVPDPPFLALAEQKVKETDISLAIHNHGPDNNSYPSPESAYKLIAKMDKRMGLCIDVGHTQRLGLDPSKEVERFFDRLLDIHMKDVSAADAKGTTVECGSGIIDIPKLLKTLAKLGYSKSLHFEHEKDAKDPLPGLAESVGYVRGVIAMI